MKLKVTEGSVVRVGKTEYTEGNTFDKYDSPEVQAWLAAGHVEEVKANGKK